VNSRINRWTRPLGIAAWSVTAICLSVFWIAHAQQGAADDDPRFTGRSSSLDTEGLRMSRRHFDAGARSAWHRHVGGQLLFVAEGRARTQKRGSALREMGVGESDYTGPNVEHWHGAAPDSHLVQVAVAFGGETEWLEKVTDEQYNGR
jgi:quercetin dioxygenase-like cupin family protein